MFVTLYLFLLTNQCLSDRDADIPVMANIEKPQAINNLDSIITDAKPLCEILDIEMQLQDGLKEINLGKLSDCSDIQQ